MSSPRRLASAQRPRRGTRPGLAFLSAAAVAGLAVVFAGAPAAHAADRAPAPFAPGAGGEGLRSRADRSGDGYDGPYRVVQPNDYGRDSDVHRSVGGLLNFVWYTLD